MPLHAWSTLLLLAAVVHFLPLISAVTKVACVGDSMTDGSCCGLTYSEIYPVKLQELLGDDYYVVDYGILSRTASKACSPSYWDSTEYADILTDDPDIVIVMLGTNDAKLNFWGSCAQDFQIDMQSLLESLQNLSSKPKIYAVYPPKVCDNPCCGISDENLVNGVIPTIRVAAAAVGSDTLDAYEYTSTKCNDWYMPDNVHLTAAGALKLAEFFHDIIMELDNTTSTQSPTEGSTTEDTSCSICHEYFWIPWYRMHRRRGEHCITRCVFGWVSSLLRVLLNWQCGECPT